jgi:hypothetical protein
MTSAQLKTWLAVGTGVGIEIGREDLNVTVARVRPNGAKILGELSIHRFRELPAAEWGATYNGFLKKLGVRHLAASVLLPRDEVIVRQVPLPGVANKDVPAALAYQIDSLHPFPEEEAAYDWARLGSTPMVLVGIARREIVDRYVSLFTEAGVKIGAFTFSAVSLYSAVRLLSVPPAEGFLAVGGDDGELEAYGESPERGMFSVRLDASPERLRSLAVAELRLEPATEPLGLEQVLPTPVAEPADRDPMRSALPYAAALAAACGWLSLRLNLLPSAQRQTSSRARWIAPAVLTALILGVLGSMAAWSKVEQGHYLADLEGEIRKLQPQAAKAATLQGLITTSETRAAQLDVFRRRSKDDLDALNELTKMLNSPTWVNGLQMTRSALVLSGETPQADGLLKLLDGSKQFKGSDFLVPPMRAGGVDVFTIRASREGVGK